MARSSARLQRGGTRRRGLSCSQHLGDKYQKQHSFKILDKSGSEKVRRPFAFDGADMKSQEKIVDELSRGPLCDDCLSEACSIHPRQQVNQRCSYLRDVGHITRVKEPCPGCGRYKLVNHMKQEAVEHLQRHRGTSIQIDETKIKPITAEDVRGEGVEVDFPLDSVLWFWEGKVQERIVEHLVRKGYQISRYANIESRESGKDIEAIAPEGQVLWITVKGYPQKSKHTQARHWFAGSLFDLILWREEGTTTELGIGLPDRFATYRNLAARVTWLKNCMPFRFYWVSEDGTVRVE